MSRSRVLLRTLFNYRSGEGRLLAQLLGLFFLKGVADVFFATSASTLYLGRYSPATLPFVYLGSAVAATVLGLAYSRLTPHVRAASLLKATLFGLSVSIAVVHAAFWATGDSRWALALMVWREVLTMLLNATLWAQVGALLHLRQGKRLFAVIASGDIVASSMGGAGIPFLIDAIGPLHLLFFAEVSLGLAVVLSLVIDRAQPTIATDDARDAPPDTRSLTMLLGERYLALFFGVSITSFIIYFVVDYNFYNVVNTQFTSPAVLASFFGTYYAVLNAVSLLMNGLVSGRLLTRYGIGVGLLALPALVGVSVAGAVAGHQWWSIGSVLFWTVVVTKLLDEMLRGAFLYPTYKILYQPLPARERIRVQAARDSAVEPVAIGVSALLLLVLTRVAGADVPQLCVMLLVVIAVFAFLAVALRREYVRVLVKALSRGRAFDDSRLLANASSVAVLRHGVRHHKASHAIYCLTLLETIDAPAATKDLTAALNSGEAELRAYALRRLRERGVRSAAARIDAIVARESTPSVLREALRASCELGDEHAIARALAHADHANLDVRTGALVGLLRQRSSPEGTTTALGHLRDLVNSNEVRERVAAARVIGESGIASLGESLRALMDDADPGVASAALRAAPGCGDRALIESLVARLDMPEIRDAAAASLVTFGTDAVAPLLRAIEIAHGPSAARLIHLLGRVGDAGRAALVERIGRGRDSLRGEAIEALSRLSYVATGEHAPPIRRVLHDELQAALRLMAIRQELSGVATAMPRLRQAIDDDIREVTRRVLMLLSFLYDRTTVVGTQRMLTHGTDEQRAQAVELIDNVLPRAEASVIMRLLDDPPPPNVSATAPNAVAACASNVVRSDVASPWSRACAVYEAAAAAPEGFSVIAHAALDDLDPLVRETATGMLARSAHTR